MEAIIVKYHGATDTHGDRVRATAGGKYLEQSRDFSCDVYVQVRRVAEALAARLGWEGRLIGGDLRKGWVFVVDNKSL